jgi:putative methyltransferase (TIGR04325 family)
MDVIVIEAFRTALREIEPNQTIGVLDVGGFDGAYAKVIKNQFPRVNFEWTVVELQAVVNHFAKSNDRISYAPNLQRSLLTKPHVVFASAVINYLSNPHEVIESFFNNAKVIILNRPPLWPLTQDQVAIQTAQRKPFLMQYPVWFFAEAQFLSRIASRSDLLLDFEVPQDRAYFAGHYSTYRGLVLQTKIQGVAG